VHPASRKGSKTRAIGPKKPALSGVIPPSRNVPETDDGQ
jgi:hypothetical protein